jgi:hypothetical protein
VQPVCVNAAGAPVWGPAVAAAPEDLAAVERRPVLVRFLPAAAPVERTLKVNSAVTVSVPEGKEAALVAVKMEGNVLESLWPDQRGIGTAIRLTLGDCPFSRDEGGKPAPIPPQAKQQLSRFSPTFLVDGSNATKERGNRNFGVLAGDLREVVEGMYETLCNTYEATTLPVPNRDLRPQETWQATLPLFVLVEGKRQVHDLSLTLTKPTPTPIIPHVGFVLSPGGVSCPALDASA